MLIPSTVVAALALIGGTGAAMYNNPNAPRFRQFNAARGPAPAPMNQFNAFGGNMPYFGMNGGGLFGGRGAGGPFGPQAGGFPAGPGQMNGMAGPQAGARPF